MATKMSRAQTIKKYDSLEELLTDKDLASLGDSFVNFVYSLAMSQKHRRPMGAKVENQTLAQAVTKSGLRKFLPHRVDRHAKGNAAEALLVFAWLSDMIDFHDCTDALSKEADPSTAFANLMRGVLEKIGVPHEGRQK
jgi:hypothetical protein